MSYYFLHKEKRIAAPIAYVALILLTFGFIFIMNRVQLSTTTQASKKVQVMRSVISNVTTHGVTFIATTSDKALFRVKYYETQNPSVHMTAFDLREGKNEQLRREHYIPIVGLKPQTSYTLQPIINGLDEKQTLQFTTYSSNDVTADQQPLFGKVLKKKLTT